MLKKLLFTLALMFVCGIAQLHAQTAQPTPTEPTQPRIPIEWIHPDDWKMLENMPECEAVTASEKMPHTPPHFEGLIIIEKRKALKQLFTSLEPLEKRGEIVSNLRVQIKVGFNGSTYLLLKAVLSGGHLIHLPEIKNISFA